MSDIHSYGLLTDELKKHLYKDIKEFRSTFRLPVEAPNEFNESADRLHSSLWIEELTELAEATTKAEIADSLVDQVYVLVGRVVQLGYWTPEVQYIVACLLEVAKDKNIPFVEAWDEVHSSNMTKLSKNDEQLAIDIEYWKEKGVEIEPIKTEAGYILSCAADCTRTNGKQIKKGKVMKSTFYRDADLQFVNNY